MGAVSGRDRELQLLRKLLDRTRTEPTVLVLDGEPGIGKTTLCRAASEMAHDAGFAVLSASGAVAEVSMAWTVLADLVAGMDQAVLTELSPLHQRALQAVSAGSAQAGADERLVAAAFRAALEQQCAQRPILIITDDAQWLDEATRTVLGFTVRRLTGPVAVIAAYRSGESPRPDRSWAQPADPQALTRLTVGPMTGADLAAIVKTRLRHTPSRRIMASIRSLSGGNPLYALELARAAQENPDRELESLPPTLAGMVRDRIGDMDPATAEAMVAVAVAFAPTVEIIAAVIDRSPDEVVELLQPMENRGVLVLDGARICFTHSLLASGVIADADPAVRRRAHRLLADRVSNPEQRARHLALSTPHGDADTLTALDTAAEAAAARGAYTSAAELLALAINRGGDTQFRRLRGADFHFRAGLLGEAETLIAPILDELPAGFMRTVGLMLLAAIRGYREGFASTIALLKRAVQEAGDDLALRTQARLLLSAATGVAGDIAGSVQQARWARTDAEESGIAELRSQALAAWVSASIIYGLGLDTEAMRAALEIGTADETVPVMFQPATVYAQTCGWTGRLEEASAAMIEVSRRCTERGNELDMIWAAEQLTMIEVGLGHFSEAARISAEALGRAQQIGGRLPLINAYTAVAHVAAHQGRVDETRSAAESAVQLATEGNLNYLARPPLMSLAFAQVSDGQYDAALQTLKPLLDNFDPDHDTEIMVGAFLPDAVEALIATGRGEEAEPLVAALEAAGERHDRPWLLAVGARCRALVSAVAGDLDGAILHAERAMAHHERLPMPFERARTQLLLGQLQRRRRRAQARDSLRGAATTFEHLGSPLWAARAHHEISRAAPRSMGSELTDAERQVAHAAAAGLTNKEIASAMFLSVKTVEMHLSSTYRKLAIRSRAQLADRLRRN